MNTLSNHQHQSPSNHQLQSNQPSNPSYNLFLQPPPPQDHLAAMQRRSKKKSFRRITIKKTPSEIIKQSILKNRQSKRVEDLKQQTKDNIRLFLRLQSQKSQYNLNRLHKHLSTSILPLAKSKVSTSNCDSQAETMTAQRVSRCSSAAPSLKFRCKSLKQNIKSSTSRTLSIRSKEEDLMLASRATSKLCLPEKDKQNMVANKIPSLNSQQQHILMKKIGLKIPIESLKRNNLSKIGKICGMKSKQSRDKQVRSNIQE